jgi:hypothetical protein
MDSGEMMINHFMEEEVKVASHEDDYLTILACLLQLQAVEMNNVAPSRGGSKFGKTDEEDGGS